ncbi:MAG TPA: hypothetical protein VFJ13_11495 [Paracoccaceae bacterium]|nr:hypothetical protein [Paracoccaceae bacterium]
MRHMILAALLVAGGSTAAMAQDASLTLVYDAAPGEKFEIKRDIVDQVQAIWGETAAYESSEALPAGIENEIAPGEQMPANAPVEPVPAALDDLPKLLDDSRWVKSGNHLVELTPDNTVAMVVYEALP